jgi:uncharacterized protein (TIGR02996 family)
MKHPDWPAFLAAIVAEPDDDTSRLVAADFLEEHGDPKRAAFIRIQCELARLEASNQGRSLAANELRGKERAFLGPFSDDPHWWATEDCPELVRVVPAVRTSSPLTNLRVEGAERLTWRRGFVERVDCPAAEWLRHGAEVRKRNPVRDVFLSGCTDITRDAWYAGFDALRGLRLVDLNADMNSPAPRAVELAGLQIWLTGWLRGTRIDLIPF